MGTHPIFESDFDCLTEMSRTVKEIVMMLELAAEAGWIDAFYLPFELIPNFRPIMGCYAQVRTCLMNIRISINEKHFNKLEESVLRIERLRPQFVKIPEVDSLAELVVEESRIWDDIQDKFESLTQAWNSMMPPTRLGKMINLMKKSNDSTMKSLMTPKSFRIIKMLSLDYSENCAISILKKLCNDYQNEYSEKKLKADLIKKPVCHKKLNFSTPLNEPHVEKSPKTTGCLPGKKSREVVEKDPEEWNRHLSDVLCKKVSNFPSA